MDPRSALGIVGDPSLLMSIHPTLGYTIYHILYTIYYVLGTSYELWAPHPKHQTPHQVDPRSALGIVGMREGRDPCTFFFFFITLKPRVE